jgi:hypothetical protein
MLVLSTSSSLKGVYIGGKIELLYVHWHQRNTGDFRPPHSVDESSWPLCRACSRIGRPHPARGALLLPRHDVPRPMPICLLTPLMSLLFGHASTAGEEVDAGQTQTWRSGRERIARRAHAEGLVETRPSAWRPFSCRIREGMRATRRTGSCDLREVLSSTRPMRRMGWEKLSRWTHTK